MTRSATASKNALGTARAAEASILFAPQLDLFDYLPITPQPGSPKVSFSDDVWDFSTAKEWPASQGRVRMRWSTIVSPDFRLAVKEIAVMTMQPAAAIHLGVIRAKTQPMAPWSFYHTRFWPLRGFLNHLFEAGHLSLETVTQEDCDQWLESIASSVRNHAIAAVRALADYRSALTCGGMAEGFRPWGEATAASISGQRPTKGENKTPVIPDEVFSPFLALNLFVVQEVAPRVIERLKEGVRPSGFVSGRNAGKAVDEALDQYMSELEVSGTPVPSYDGIKPSLSFIARQIGLLGGETPIRRNPSRMERISEAVQAVGVQSVGRDNPGSKIEGLAVPLLRVYEGKPVKIGPLRETQIEEFVLHACLSLVASLTGMRTSELATITANSLEEEYIAENLTRYRIRGRLLKGQKMGGRVERWLTVEESATAIKVATALSAKTDPQAPLFNVQGFEYASFIAALNQVAALTGMTPVPAEWHFHLRQFRRKVSREMAYRNFGIIAAMKALKHQSVLTTEGYAGSRGGALISLQREIEQQRNEVNQDEIQRLFRGYLNGESVAGLGAKALTAQFEEARQAIANGAGAVREDDALRKIIKDFGKNLHTGPAAHCWFRDPALARCLKDREDKSKPLAGLCNPIDCPNSTIHPQHAEVWLGNLSALEDSIKDKRIPGGEKQRIRPLLDKVRRIVDTLQQEN